MKNTVVGITIACLLLSILVLVMKSRKLEQQLEDQSFTVERRQKQCFSIRYLLNDARRSLLSDRADLRSWGRGLFEHLTHDNWEYANTCASESVFIGASCVDDDLPCQLHTLDWAIVNVR